MQGRRFEFDPFHDDPIYFQDGDYGLWRGFWYCKTPNGLLGLLENHTVIENADKTITVSPSILVTERENGVDKAVYHGFLKNGVWTDC